MPSTDLFTHNPAPRSDMHPVIQVFECMANAIDLGIPSVKENARDKEFHFQDWIQNRLVETGLSYDPPGRHKYPDYTLVHHALGFEVKGLAFPGRVADFDCNSAVPKPTSNGRDVYYIFGRYPKKVGAGALIVHDLVLCTARFLNADTNYVHNNTNFAGFGSYGDIKVRDRKMYICPTPFALTTGTERQVTLILDQGNTMDLGSDLLVKVGELERTECAEIVVGYEYDMRTHKLLAHTEPNPSAGLVHKFDAYKIRGVSDSPVQIRQD